MICICCNTRFQYPATCPSCGYPPAASVEPEDFMIGERIASRYMIVAALGTGRFGTCFRARDDRFQVDVVLKFIHPGYLPETTFIDRFVSGMRFLQQNNYAITTRVIDVGVHDGKAYVASELVEGVPLRDLMANRQTTGRAFSVAEVFPVMRQLAAYLIESDAGPHGALCPENIWIMPGSLKVMEPGLVENLPAGVLEIRLMANSETAAYVAPELRSGKGLCQQSDVFSLGVLLAEMLSGIQFQGRLDSLLARSAGTLSPVESILRRALADSAQVRFGDAESFIGALAAAARVNPPRFVRPWGTQRESSNVKNPTAEPEVERTQQVAMDDVISRHYEEITAITRNPLLQPQKAPLPNVPLPNAPPPNARVIVAPPAKPKVPERTTLAPPAAPPPPKPKRQEPAERTAITPPGPPRTPAHAREGLRSMDEPVLESDELSDMLPIEELSGLMEVPDEKELPTASRAAAKLERQAADAASSSTEELLRRASALDGVDPRFIRAAHRLETERISEQSRKSAEIVREHQKDLDGIDPRLIRAAARLEQARIAEVPRRESSGVRPMPERGQGSPGADDDWRSRIASESTNDPDSVISFLSPATHERNSEVEGFPRMNQRQARNRPPTAPPPPRKR